MANDNGLPKVFTIDEKLRKRFGEGTCVVPRPRDVEAIMSEVPSGKLITIDELRRALARQHGANTACPITTGIFAWMAAHAAEEAEAEGKSPTVAYWRTLKTGGEVNAKYPGGIAAISKKLEEEGHALAQRGKRWFVQGFEKNLVKQPA